MWRQRVSIISFLVLPTSTSSRLISGSRLLANSSGTMMNLRAGGSQVIVGSQYSPIGLSGNVMTGIAASPTTADIYAMVKPTEFTGPARLGRLRRGRHRWCHPLKYLDRRKFPPQPWELPFGHT